MYVLAFTEVLDKELTVLEAWIFAIIVGSCGYVLSRWKPWLGILPLIGITGAALAVAAELSDPHVGPLLLDAAGESYPALIYGAFTFAIVATFVGMWHGVMHGRGRPEGA